MKESREIKWIVDENGCWNCTSHCLTSTGYPHIKRKRKTRKISHLQYEKYLGSIPKGYCVLHRCDNKLCINPEHLFLGTRNDNMRDMCEKNRQVKGENQHNAKLTTGKILQIREMAKYKSQSELGRLFAVSVSLIHAIVHRKIWKHVA